MYCLQHSLTLVTPITTPFHRLHLLFLKHVHYPYDLLIRNTDILHSYSLYLRLVLVGLHLHL